MIPLTAAELRALELGDLQMSADVVTGAQIDSRRVSPGDLFVALGGGVAFLDEARSRGAAATLVPADEFAAMAALGRAVRERSDARVVAITGSSGKTSTKDILSALCRPVARTVAAEEGHNNEIGLPLTLMRLEPDTDVLITEMGMRGLGQIAALCEIALPDVGVITNIGPVHLELLGTIDRVAQAKAELLHALPPGGIAVIPADAPELQPYVPDGLDVRRFPAPEVEVRDGVAFVQFNGNAIPFSFTARHQAANAVAALTVVDALGLPLPETLVEVPFSRWRCEESQLPGDGLLINDAYNANPASMRAALEHLVERAGGRHTVAVLGDMAELGVEAPRYHEEVGAFARELGVDVIVGVGDLARGYGPDEWAADAAAAKELARTVVASGDTVLVKGSRAVGLEVVAEALNGVTTP
ncbi:MAG: UDP-N-acetylmuramoyl-tripeptide--D-alanyl-D-alanine ligase [Gaiellaceae bacterium]|nr:UDP-N-acetylmuramoyl-tripeptide--D-alanyl-D-alanine ligase [Gaiellaceae bacterium]